MRPFFLRNICPAMKCFPGPPPWVLLSFPFFLFFPFGYLPFRCFGGAGELTMFPPFFLPAHCVCVFFLRTSVAGKESPCVIAPSFSPTFFPGSSKGPFGFFLPKTLPLFRYCLRSAFPLGNPFGGGLDFPCFLGRVLFHVVLVLCRPGGPNRALFFAASFGVLIGSPTRPPFLLSWAPQPSLAFYRISCPSSPYPFHPSPGSLAGDPPFSGFFRSFFVLFC